MARAAVGYRWLTARIAVWFAFLLHLSPALGVSASPVDPIDALRLSADLERQRELAWQLFTRLTIPRDAGSSPSFTDWRNEAEVFAPDADAARMTFPGAPIGAGFLPAMQPKHLADAPILTFVHYNPDAYAYVRKHGLYRKERLEELMHTGARDPGFPDQRTIGELPSTSAIIMTGWWPVSGRGVTALPTWSATDRNIRLAGGNSYTNWTRAVGIDPQLAESISVPPVDLVFAGRTFTAAPRVTLQRFYHVRLQQNTAEQLMRNPGARKAALIALGRPLREGDFLALVALHLTTLAGGNGVWQTHWWDLQAVSSDFGRGRPSGLQQPWRNYVMDVTLDATVPRDPDGSPRTCFNPWFEGAFPGETGSNGIRSNCLSCHDRASYPRTDFLPIKRGEPDPRNDPAYAAGRLRTARIWALANPEATAAPR